jgi:hypothetical protein
MGDGPHIQHFGPTEEKITKPHCGKRASGGVFVGADPDSALGCRLVSGPGSDLSEEPAEQTRPSCSIQVNR